MYALPQLSLHDVRENLELAMPMSAKACARRNAVLVDDAKRAKLHVVPVLIAVSIVRELNFC